VRETYLATESFSAALRVPIRRQAFRVFGAITLGTLNRGM